MFKSASLLPCPVYTLWTRALILFIAFMSVPPAHPSMLPPRFHPHSSPEDSDTAADITELALPTCMSPETVLEKYDDEEKRMEAQERRQFALSELVGSERDYVEKLEYCIEVGLGRSA